MIGPLRRWWKRRAARAVLDRGGDVAYELDLSAREREGMALLMARTEVVRVEGPTGVRWHRLRHR